MSKNLEITYVVMVLLSLYILVPIKTPMYISTMISSFMGRVIVMSVAFAVFLHDYKLGAIFLIAAYVLVKRSETNTFLFESRKSVTEKVKSDQIQKMNERSQWNNTTLEEEIVKQIPMTVSLKTHSQFKPLLNDIHDAARL